MATYQTDIPRDTDVIAVSQEDIQQNFLAISNLIGIDHANFGSSNEGQHNKITLPLQGSAPTFVAGTNGMYNLLDATTAQNEVYIHKQNAAGAVNIPFTSSILGTTSPIQGGAGWTYLPSGIYLAWGSTSANGLATITLPNPPPTQLLSVQLTTFTSSTGYQDSFVRLVSLVSNSQFQVYGSINGVASSTGFQYFAIGW